MSFQSKGLGAEAWTATQQGRDIANEGACKILHHKSNSKQMNDNTKRHKNNATLCVYVLVSFFHALQYSSCCSLVRTR